MACATPGPPGLDTPPDAGDSVRGDGANPKMVRHRCRAVHGIPRRRDVLDRCRGYRGPRGRRRGHLVCGAAKCRAGVPFGARARRYPRPGCGQYRGQRPGRRFADQRGFAGGRDRASHGELLRFARSGSAVWRRRSGRTRCRLHRLRRARSLVSAPDLHQHQCSPRKSHRSASSIVRRVANHPPLPDHEHEWRQRERRQLRVHFGRRCRQFRGERDGRRRQRRHWLRGAHGKWQRWIGRQQRWFAGRRGQRKRRFGGRERRGSKRRSSHHCRGRSGRLWVPFSSARGVIGTAPRRHSEPLDRATLRSETVADPRFDRPPDQRACGTLLCILRGQIRRAACVRSGRSLGDKRCEFHQRS